MDSLLFTVGSFLVALAILIAVHEFGHFWVARKLGVKVLKFSIGFGRPLIRKVGKVDGTEYVLAAIPLGGYVKMLDEREGPVPEKELSRAFNRQSLPVRSAIVVAGPLFNFLFAILAYWMVFVTGDVGMRPLVGEVQADSAADVAGFVTGDEILAVAGKETPSWESVVYALLTASLEGKDLPVRIKDESGVPQERWIEGRYLQGLSEDGDILERLGMPPKRPVIPAVIGQLVRGEAAERAGFQTGDRIISVDGQTIESWPAWVDYVQAHPGVSIAVSLQRGGQTMDLPLEPAPFQSEGKTIGRIGAAVDVPEHLYDEYRVEIKLGPFDALVTSLRKTWDFSVLTLEVLGKMLLGQVSVDNLSGPISIAESAGKSASVGLSYFVKFLAVVSISLGILNLLPVPVLDGGHLLFFLVEAIKGSPLSDEAQMQAQKVGLFLLLALMSLAFYVDINRLLG